MASEIRYIDVDCIGETTGTRYVGNFEIKLFLTLKDRAEAGKVRHRILKDILETDDIYFLLQLLSNINVHLVGKKPAWWGEDGTELADTEPIISIATALREAQQVEIEGKKSKTPIDAKKE
jgi:hypothetical protein